MFLATKGYTTANGMTANSDTAFTYTYTNGVTDTETYSISAATGEKITNQLDSADMTYYGYDEMNNAHPCCWTGTWPEKIAIEANDALLADIQPVPEL